MNFSGIEARLLEAQWRRNQRKWAVAMALSLLLHLAVVAVLVWPAPPPDKEEETVAVDLVAPPTPKPPPEPPKPPPEPPKAEEPKPEPPKAQPTPPPEQPKPEAPPPPPPKPAAPKPPPPAAMRPPPPKLNLGSGDLAEKSADGQPSEGGVRLAEQSPAARTAREILLAQVFTIWTPPEEMRGRHTLIDIRVPLLPNGMLGPPFAGDAPLDLMRIINPSLTPNTLRWNTLANLVRAVHMAQPFRLPPELKAKAPLVVILDFDIDDAP